MPTLYVEATDELIVKLENSEIMDDWGSSDAEKICDEYGHPKTSFNIVVENPDDPIAELLIFVSDKDCYEGTLNSEKVSDTEYKFSINGKFKVKAHKDVVAAVVGNAPFHLEGVSRFRQAYAFDTSTAQEHNLGGWTISNKKL